MARKSLSSMDDALSAARWVAGIDEAGRGTWAGPVVASCVVLGADIPGVDDSKKLTKKQRAETYARLQEHRKVWIGVGTATAEEIDDINILEATKLAMLRAYDALLVQPDIILIDYIDLPFDVPSFGIPQGDARFPVIGAASIVAKVTRDHMMVDLAERYPGYGFAQHKGYGTKVHMDALAKHGPCPLHRRTFKPVQKYA